MYPDEQIAKVQAYAMQNAIADGNQLKQATHADTVIKRLAELAANLRDNRAAAAQIADRILGSSPKEVASQGATVDGPSHGFFDSISRTILEIEHIASETRGELRRLSSAF